MMSTARRSDISNQVHHRDFIQSMPESQQAKLHNSYAYNVAFGKHLTHKTNDLQKYEKAKRKRVMGEQVERLMYIRKATTYNKLMKDLIKTVGIQS